MPPYQLASFFRTRAAKRDTITLAGLFRQIELLSAEPFQSPAQSFPNVRRGELLCTAYEIFRSLVPDSALTIDHAALLAIALARAEEIRLIRCSECKGLMVADQLSLEADLCVYCDEDSEELPHVR